MDHISHSQASQILRCPAQYRFRYIDGIKIPPPAAIHFGIAVDEGLSVNYGQKIQTEKDLSAADVTDAFLDKFDHPETDVDWQGEDPADLRETGVGLVALHMASYAPTIFPKAVQDRLTIKFEGLEKPVMMVPDIITREGSVHDIKTCKKSPSKNPDGSYKLSPEHFHQGALYAAGHEAKYGFPATGVQMSYHVKTKTPKIVTAKVVTTPAQEQFTIEQLARAAKMIDLCTENDLWIPNRSHMMCSKKQCGFWDLCIAKYGADRDVMEAQNG